MNMKDYEKADLKIKNEELEDLNTQYFENILQLKRDYGILEFACIFELIIIVLLSLVIVL